MINGRYLYQAPGKDRYLEYISSNYWIIGDGVGKSTGYISHDGGSVCPEYAVNSWEVSVWYEDTKRYGWEDDTLFTVECKQEDGVEEHKKTDKDDKKTELSYDMQHEEYDRSSIIGLSITSFILFTVLVIIFGTKFYRSWSKGLQGKQLLLETIEL